MNEPAITERLLADDLSRKVRNMICSRLRGKRTTCIDIDQLVIDSLIDLHQYLRDRLEQKFSDIDVVRLCKTFAKRKAIDAIRSQLRQKRSGFTITFDTTLIAIREVNGTLPFEIDELWQLAIEGLDFSTIQILSLRRNGSTLSEIAKLRGCCVRTIERTLARCEKHVCEIVMTGQGRKTSIKQSNNQTIKQSKSKNQRIKESLNESISMVPSYSGRVCFALLTWNLKNPRSKVS